MYIRKKLNIYQYTFIHLYTFNNITFTGYIQFNSIYLENTLYIQSEPEICLIFYSLITKANSVDNIITKLLSDVVRLF